MSSGPWSIIDGLSFKCFFCKHNFLGSWPPWGPNPAVSCLSMFLFCYVLVLLLLTHPTKASFPHTCTYLHQRKREEKINEWRKEKRQTQHILKTHGFYPPLLQSVWFQACACCMLSRFSHVHLFVTPWAAVCQVLLSMEFFPIQGLNPGLLHCRQILYHLSLLLY